MSDFAHGIPPPRYPCKRVRPTSSSDSRYCMRKPTDQTTDRSRRAIHWSLDEGRWIFNDTDDKSKRGGCKASNDDNLFVSFKMVVDRGLEALNFSKRQRERVVALEKSKRDAHMRWTGQSSEYDAAPNGPRSEALKTAGCVLGVAKTLAFDSHVPLRKIQLLFRDQENENTSTYSWQDRWLAAGGAWYFLPEVGDRLPSAAALCRPPAPPPPRWLSILWFKQSPYSPVQVEAVEGLPGPPERWRAAFEDLMAASLGRPMSSCRLKTRIRNDKPLRFPGIDWVLSLQTRLILPPLLPSLYDSRGSRTVETNIIGRRISHDYQEFSELVDEIWKSNRAISTTCSVREAQQASFGPAGRCITEFTGYI